MVDYSVGVLFLPLRHDIETSSRCPQLCSPHPLCAQSARFVSDPVQCMLSIQIMPSPGPYSWPKDLPEFLLSTVHTANYTTLVPGQNKSIPPPKRLWFGSGVRIRSPYPDDFQNLTGTSLFKVTFMVKFPRRSDQFVPVSYTHLTLPTIYSV